MAERDLDHFSKGRNDTEPPAGVSIFITNLPPTFQKQRKLPGTSAERN